MAYLDDLRRKLAARTNADGKPIKGYGQNVAAIRAEIARMESTLAAAIANTTESAVDMPQEHV